MSSEWPVVRLADITSILGDGLHGTPEYDETGEYYFINGNNLSNGKIIFNENTKRCAESEYHKHKKNLNDRTLLVSINGTLGNIALYNGEKVFLGKSACYFNVLDSVDRLFVRYILSGRIFQNYIHNLANGSTIKNVSLKLMRDFSFQLPPLKIQKIVSSILGSLDNKIGLNNQTNQTLEQIAQAIFKSWFVAFDPVKAKIAALESGGTKEAAELAAMSVISGKDEAQLVQLKLQDADAYQQLAQTAALFPAAMQESELGDIPEGWNTKPLDSIAHYQNGLALQKFRPEDDSNYLPIVKIADLKKGIADHTEKASPDIKPTSVIDNGDVVFSWSGSLMVDIWCGGKAALNQHLFKVTSSQYPKWFFHLFTKHHLEEFQRIAAAKAVTMGHIKKEHLTQAICVVPCDDILLVGNKVIGYLIDKQIKLRLENNLLTELRDSLLPKLLSGEISITDLEGSQKELTE